MNGLESTIVWVQWGIIAFFVLVNFLIGFKRGTKKSLYYTIVSFILTIVLLFGVSFITIRAFFTPGSLLDLIERYVTIPENIRVYLTEPELSAVAFAFIDVVIRIIFFIILYPVVKWLLTLIIFRPIYKMIFHTDPKVLRTVDMELVNNRPQLVVNEKKIRKSISSRMVGATFGAVRGFIVAFIFLLPVLLVTSLTRGFEGENTDASENINHLETVLATNGIDSNEILDILKLVQHADNNGLGQITRNIKIGGKGLDDYLFDFVFTTQIVTSDKTEDLVIREELRSVGNIATLLIEAGYLDESFEVKDINYDDHYEDIDIVIQTLGKSDLLNLLVPIGVDVASRHFLPDMLGFDPNLETDEAGNKLHTSSAIEALKKIRLEHELQRINNIVKAALSIGSVEQLMEIADNPESFLELDVETQRLVATILREAGHLELLQAANLGIEMMIRDESFTSSFDWIEDPIDYFHNRLGFILNNPAYFVGEDGDIANIANLVDALFADEFSDFDYTVFMGDLTPEMFLTEDVSPLVSAALVNIVNVETVLKAIPFGIDYFVYGTKPELIEDVSDDLVNALENQNYGDEILNIDSIYREAVSIGLSQYFEDEAVVIEITDQILSNPAHMTSIRKIVKNIFEDSKVVNDVLEIVAKPVVETLVDDEDIKTLALKVVDSDIKYGSELNKVLDLVESAYTFTTIGTVMDAMEDGQMEAYLNLAADFGGINNTEFNQFKTALTSLETLNIIGIDLLELVKEKAEITQIVIPENANLNYDLNRILNLAYEVSVPLNTSRASGVDVLDINLSEVLDHGKMAEVLRFTQDDESSILLASAVEFIKTLEFEIPNIGIITTPVELIIEDFNSEVWMNELNNLTSGLFNTLPLLVNDEFTLSYNYLTNNVKGLADVPVSLVTNLTEDEELVKNSIGKLFDTYLLRANATNLGENLIEDLLKDQAFSIEIPNLVIGSDGYVIGEELTELVLVGTHLVSELDARINASNLQTLVDGLSLEVGVQVFNDLDKTLLRRVSESAIINGVFRDAVLNEDLHTFVYDILRDINLDSKLSPLNSINSGVFDLDVSLVNGEVELTTLYELLSAAQDLQVPYTLINNPSNDDVMDYLNTVPTSTIVSILEVKLVHEIFDNIIKLPEVKAVGSNYFNDLNQMLAEQNINLNLSYDYYYDIINLPVDNNNLFSIDEIKDLIDVYAAARQIIDFNDLNNIDILEVVKALETTEVGRANGYEVLTKPVLVRGLIGLALNDNDVLTFGADYINERAVLNGDTLLNLDANDLRLSSQFFSDSVVLDHNHLLDLVLAVAAQDLDLINRNFDIQLSDITNLLDKGLAISELNRLEQVYNSEIIEYVLTKVIENEELAVTATNFINDEIAKLSDQLGINPTQINKNDLGLSFNLINLEAMTKAVIALDELNISSFNDLTSIRSISDAGLVLDLANTDSIAIKVFEIPIIEHVLTTVLTHDIIGNTIVELLENRVLPELPFTVNLPSAEAFKLNAENLTAENYADLLVAVYGTGIDIDERDPLNAISTLLKTNTAAGNEMLGIEHLYNSRIVNDLVSAVERDDLQTSIVDLVNGYIDRLADTLNVSAVYTNKEELNITKDLVDVTSATKLLVAIDSLNISSFNDLTSIRSISDAANLLELEATDMHVRNIVEIPFVYHVFEVAFTNDVVSKMAFEYVNKLLPASIDVKEEFFKFDEALITKDEFVNLVVGAYGSGLLKTNNLNNPRLFNDLLRRYKSGGRNITGVEHIFSSNLIYHTLDDILRSDDLRNSLIDILNNELEKRNINYTITAPNSTFIPELALNEEGRIKVSEFKLLVEAIAALNLDSYQQLSSVSGINDVLELMSRESLDTMLDSEIVYYLVGYAPLSDSALENYANLLNTQLNLRFTLTKEDLAFNKYQGIFNESGVHAGYITKDELGLLLDALQATNIADLAFSGNTFNIVNTAVDVLLVDDTLDHYFASNVLKALLDKVFNVDNTNIERLYITLINRLVEPRLGHEFTMDDDIFNYHGNAYDDSGMITPEEVRKVLIALDILQPETGFGVQNVLDLVDRNIVDGEDDFDRVYTSFIIQSLISNVIQNDGFRSVLANEVNKGQSTITITDDKLIIPSDALIEGLINPAEIKALLRTVNVLELGSFDFGNLNVASFTNLIDQNIVDGRDDFDRMLDSVIIHNIISEVLKSKELGEMVGNTLSEMFDKEIKEYDMSADPSLEDVNGRLGRNHIKDIFKSVKLLEIIEFSDIENLEFSSIMDLIDQNEEAGIDDLNRFLSSEYIRMTMSKLLSSNTIREELATSGKFDKEDFTLNAAKEDDNYLSKDEIYNIFIALNTLGINDISNIDISNETLKQLTDDELDTILKSAYMYQYIDLTLKGQLEDIPAAAINNDVADKFNGYILRSEIKGLIEGLKVLDVENPEDINDELTIRQLDEIIQIESAIINKLISDEIINQNMISVPDESKSDGVITNDEFENLVNALKLLTNDVETMLKAIDMTTINVTTTLLADLLNINDPAGSPIINRLISENIINVLGDENIHEDAYLSSSKLDIKRSELIKLNEALEAIGMNEINNEFNIISKTFTELEDAYNKESLIVYVQISEGLDSKLDTTGAKDAEDRYVKDEEISLLFSNVNFINEDLTEENKINNIDNLADYFEDLDPSSALTLSTKIINSGITPSTIIINELQARIVS